MKVAKDEGCQSVTAHVQTNNNDARQFYEKFGFTLAETLADYYKHDTEVKSAWVFHLDLDTPQQQQ
jgi:ribosomal protein S18 acetylase RimI-like enzyme